MFARFCVLALLFVVCFAQMAFGQQSKIDSYLTELLNERDNAQDCLISFHSQIETKTAKHLNKEEKGQLVFETLKMNAVSAQKNVIQILKNENLNYQSIIVANCIHVKLDKETIEEIAAFPEVKRIMYNPSVMLEEPMIHEAVNAREPEPEWGIQMINADSVWALGYKGQDVIIAGQDTGYDWDNDVLKHQYRGYVAGDDSADHNYNWHDAISEINLLHGDTIVTDSTNPCGLNLIIPCDDHNHGTHTMGTMVGSDTINAIGVAPQSKWIACRNMERGYGSPATYLDCFEWFLAPTDLNEENPDPSKAPHVINNSWSCPEMEGCNESNWSVLEEAVNNLKNAGIVVVVSAGNSGPGCNTINTPSAIFEQSFTVGATAINDSIAAFSSRGAITVDGSLRLKPNVAAPGVNVRSCIRDNQYRNFSGTSMAGPHVAGAVALIISANPNLAGQVEQIENILEATAIAKTDTLQCGDFSALDVPNIMYGHGRIDVLAAVEEALRIASVEDLSFEKPIKIFPNPANEFVTVAIYENENTKVKLYNSVGQFLGQQDVLSDRVQFDLSAFPAGIYYFSIELGGKGFVEKFVKVGR